MEKIQKYEKENGISFEPEKPVEPTEEEKQIEKERQDRIKFEMAEQAESEQIYQKRIKEETLKTFIDVPERIETIIVTKCTENAVKIKWNPPESNNSKITSYKIYLKDGGKFSLIGTSPDPSFELKDLEEKGTSHLAHL
jgi:hypothetical protein